MLLKEVGIWVGRFSEFSELIPLFIWFLKKRQLGQLNEYALLGNFFLLSSLLRISTNIPAILGVNNMPMYHILAMVELIFIFLIYDNMMFKDKSKINWLWVLLIFNLTDTLFLEGIYSFNSISWSVNTVLYIFLGLYYYYYLYKHFDGFQIEKYPYFYINAGFLLYAAGSLFTYLFAWKILSKPANDFFHSGWIIHSIANTAKNMIVGYGLWLIRLG